MQDFLLKSQSCKLSHLSSVPVTLKGNFGRRQIWWILKKIHLTFFPVNLSIKIPANFLSLIHRPPD